MSFNPNQRRKLFDALRDAFTPAQFKRLLLHQLNVRQEEIVSDSADFQEVLYEVIEEAERSDWLPKLVDATLEERPTNEVLQKLFKILQPPPPPAPPTYAHILFISTLGDTAALPRNAGSAPLPQLFDLVKENAVKQQASNPAFRIHESKDRGVVIIISGDALALLKFTVDVVKTVNSSGVGQPRMGLHSIVCVDEAINGQLPKVPLEGVEIARRVTQLASDGHILATRDVAELLKVERDFEAILEAGFDALFHEPLKCELRPFLDKEIYNVYLRLSDGDKQQTVFGSESPPKTKAPEGVIKKIQVPETLRVLREEKIRVVFCEEVSYAKVKFEFENVAGSNIRISCEKPEEEDCTFEYDFEDPREVREHLFTIQAIDAAKDHNFLVRMQCYDRQGEKIIRPREWPVKLRRNFWLWLWGLILQWLREKFWPLPWYVKVIPVATLALGIAIYLALVPRKYTGNWTENFTAEEIEKIKSRWDFKEGMIEPDNGEEVLLISGGQTPTNKAGAILVKGPGMMLAKPDAAKTLYDFKVHFKVRFVRGGKAAWVFRAQPDGLRGYVFVLEQKDGKLFLRGYKSLELRGEFDNIVREVDVPTCCDRNDAFDMIAKVEGGTIRHSISIENTESHRDGINREEPYILREFKDESNSYPSGGAGLALPDNSVMKVEYWFLNPEEIKTTPSEDPSPQ